jgi:hypothetical protein
MRLYGSIKKSWVDIEGCFKPWVSDPFCRYQHGGGKDGGGGGSSSPPPAPTPPDPYATAQAQGGQDRQTAQTNALLLNPNVNSPYGNIGYDVNYYNMPGETITRPTQTITLSPAQQEELAARNQVSKNLGQAGINLSQRLPQSELLAPGSPERPTSIDYSKVSAVPTMDQYAADRDKASKSIYEQQYALMAPSFEEERKGLENRLIQTGNPLGSEAYNTQLSGYLRNKDASLQNLANTSVSQGYNVQNQLFNNANIARNQQIQDAQLGYNTANQIRGDQLAENQLLRNQQINELSAILQGREAITLPVGGQYNQNALQAPNIAGMINSNYQGQLGSYNQQMNAYNQQQMQQQQNSYNSGNAMTSGLFSMGSAAMGLFG